MISSLHPDRRRLLGQLTRFVISGAFVTALSISVYAFVAFVLGWHPQLANLIAYVIAVATGYFMHSMWSFKGHGDERTHKTKMRFVLVSVVSYALNAFWVWLLFSHLHLGKSAPIAPMLFVTPAVTFVLNRHWVFR